MVKSASPADVAVAFIQAFARKEMAEMTKHIAADIVFESPQIQIHGAEAVTEAMGKFVVVSAVNIIAVFGDSEHAVIIYDMTTDPFGTLCAANHLIVRDGKIVSDQLVFDSYEMRKLREHKSPAQR